MALFLGVLDTVWGTCLVFYWEMSGHRTYERYITIMAVDYVLTILFILLVGHCYLMYGVY